MEKKLGYLVHAKAYYDTIVYYMTINTTFSYTILISYHLYTLL